jgi:class 3 adenylate cyclase
VVFAAIALRLNGLVGNSILKPIAEMLAMVNRIKKGDFSRRIKVVSNDEIGVLADAGNEMIRGLAERERIRDTFGKYVTPEIRDEILAGRIPLDGIRAEATLLFSDLRSFTHYVEENDPEEVIDSMRVYFTAMEEAIRKHNGLVLQYVGDEIEAVFGIPISDRFHPDNALFAALDMRKRLEALNHKRESTGRPAFRHGIGICTGNVLAGNTGSENHLSYALIGDTVNLASRIQELTKRFHCDILVSHETVKNLGHSFNLEEMSPQPVRGYSKSIRVCRLIGSE